MAVEAFEPQRLATNGLKAQRDYAGQIIRQLAGMEERYFESRQRYCRLDGPRQQGKSLDSRYTALGCSPRLNGSGSGVSRNLTFFSGRSGPGKRPPSKCSPRKTRPCRSYPGITKSTWTTTASAAPRRTPGPATPCRGVVLTPEGTIPAGLPGAAPTSMPWPSRTGGVLRLCLLARKSYLS